MKKSYKLGLAAIAVSALLVGCGGSDTTTNPPVTNPPVTDPGTPTEPGTPVGTSLQNFVSGNTFAIGEATVVFASGGAYYEEFHDDGFDGTCEGTWTVTGVDTLETTATCDDGLGVSTNFWKFNGELADGMSVSVDDDNGHHEGTLTLQ